MWLLSSVLAGLPSFAADPAVATRVRVALDERRATAERERAIVGLASLCSPEANAALDAVVQQVGAWSPLGRVAVERRIERAPLADLADHAWPEWASPLVAARIEAELPLQCGDPDLWRWNLPADAVIRECGANADIPALVTAATHEPELVARRQAARLLSDLAQVRGEEAVGRELLAAVRWRDHEPLPLVDGAPVLGVLIISEALRGALAIELVCWRVSLVLVGRQDLPGRLDGELAMLLAPEVAAYGRPAQTIDWLYLLAVGGWDPAQVIDRLGVRGDRGYSSVLDDLHTLSGTPRALLPLLGHRSPIVRARAAEALEAQPDKAIAALNRAARWHPGRTFPLRGELVAPRLVRSPADSQLWTDELMEWVALASTRMDSGELRGVLSLLAEPTNTTALSALSRQEVAQTLVAAAEKEVDMSRAALLAQGMDAVLRQVPLAQGLMPAPEQIHAW